MNNIQLEEAKKKEILLIERLKSFKKVLVAFSGGVDSTYLLAVARESLGDNCKGIFARGPMISSQEEKEALALVERNNFQVQIIEVDVLNLPEFTNNPPNRCYFCKKKLFKAFIEYNQEEDNATVIEGTNASDVLDYRPGRIALQELGVISPLHDVGLTKAEIRSLSHLRNLTTWNKPSMACLASRIPYGDSISLELLQRIGHAEAILYEKGYIESRVRVHGEIARIEIPVSNFSKLIQEHTEISALLSELGFKFVTLDLMGLRSGSLNPISREALYE